MLSWLHDSYVVVTFFVGMITTLAVSYLLCKRWFSPWPCTCSDNDKKRRPGSSWFLRRRYIAVSPLFCGKMMVTPFPLLLTALICHVMYKLWIGSLLATMATTTTRGSVTKQQSEEGGIGGGEWHWWQYLCRGDGGHPPGSTPTTPQKEAAAAAAAAAGITLNRLYHINFVFFVALGIYPYRRAGFLGSRRPSGCGWSGDTARPDYRTPGGVGG